MQLPPESLWACRGHSQRLPATPRLPEAARPCGSRKSVVHRNHRIITLTLHHPCVHRKESWKYSTYKTGFLTTHTQKLLSCLYACKCTIFVSTNLPYFSDWAKFIVKCKSGSSILSILEIRMSFISFLFLRIFTFVGYFSTADGFVSPSTAMWLPRPKWGSSGKSVTDIHQTKPSPLWSKDSVHLNLCTDFENN